MGSTEATLQKACSSDITRKSACPRFSCFHSKKKKHVTLNGKRHMQKAVKRIAVFDYNTKVVTQHNSKPKVRFFRKPPSSQTSFVHFTGLLRPFQMAQALNLEGKPKIMKNIQTRASSCLFSCFNPGFTRHEELFLLLLCLAVDRLQVIDHLHNYCLG